ncbi:hypothetical protein BS47DRAFT_1394252 [Hydnum rufescens UP504]|uniref:Ras modification protein ERF4 n=1 Tax=Hydnum rufescens UP504 TaxID=1448309 RepID=A0A9P6DV70_9AGAM|nr:hypothetical protein BS47DRAFT_1394252 [Hydnum rufescens UP504]
MVAMTDPSPVLGPTDANAGSPPQVLPALGETIIDQNIPSTQNTVCNTWLTCITPPGVQAIITELFYSAQLTKQPGVLPTGDAAISHEQPADDVHSDNQLPASQSPNPGPLPPSPSPPPFGETPDYSSPGADDPDVAQVVIEVEDPSQTYSVDNKQHGRSSPTAQPIGADNADDDPLAGRETEYTPSRAPTPNFVGPRKHRHKRISLQLANQQSSDFGHESKIRSPRSPFSQPEIGIPHSSYYTGPPGMNTAFGTDPTRCDRCPLPSRNRPLSNEIILLANYHSRFHPTFPLELEGRITPTQFQETINDINEVLISAYNQKYSLWENIVAALTLYIRGLIDFFPSGLKEMRRLEALIEEKNTAMYHPQGLHILWPRNVAFMFLEIEYYVRTPPSLALLC